MVKKILHKLLGKSSALRPDALTALKELAALVEQRPKLAQPVAVLREVLPALYTEPINQAPPTLTQEHAARQLSAGLPLLRGQNLSLDERAFRRRWAAMCTALQKHQPAADLAALANCVRPGRLSAGRLLAQLLAGEPQVVHTRGKELGADPGQFATIFRLALYPVLALVQESLLARAPKSLWRHGHCWCCGAWPSLGELRGLEQTRVLRCGWCAAEWEFPRSVCPFCGNDDHRTLDIWHAAGEENRYRAMTCDGCRAYLKMVTTLHTLTAPALLVADLATTHLDLIMLERGYGLFG
jgi:FdhE protein